MFEVDVIKPFFDVKENKTRRKNDVFICDKNRYLELMKKGYIIPHKKTKAQIKRIEKENKEKFKALTGNRFSKKHWEQKKVRHKVPTSRIEHYSEDIVRSFLSDLYLRKIKYNDLSERVKKYYKNEQGIEEDVSYNSKKLVVNYIRHNLTNYDKLLSEAGQFYKDDKISIHNAMKIEVYELIKNMYPNLSAECEAFKKHDEKYMKF